MGHRNAPVRGGELHQDPSRMTNRHTISNRHSAGQAAEAVVDELARRPRDRRALETFIAYADIAVDEPFDIHRGRVDLAEELLRNCDKVVAGRI